MDEHDLRIVRPRTSDALAVRETCIMSTSTDSLAALNSPGERRFYPRVAPSRPIYVTFGRDNLGMLLNLGENGLLVSTPIALDLNSVFRVSLRLHGVAKPIDVHVRTVWTTESTKRAGIQLLDLSEHDREQLRKWGALELSRQENAEPAIPRAQGSSEPPQEEPAPPPPAVEFAKKPENAFGPFFDPPLPTIAPADVGYPAPPRPPTQFGKKSENAFGPSFDPPLHEIAPADVGYPIPQLLAASRRYRRKRSATPAIVAWSVLAAVICLAAALFFDPSLAQRFANRSNASPIQSAYSNVPGPLPGALDTQVPATSNPSPSIPDVPSAKTASPRRSTSDADLDSPSADTTAKYVDPKPFTRNARKTDAASASKPFAAAADSPSAITTHSSNSDSAQFAANAVPSTLPTAITSAPLASQPLAAIPTPVAPALSTKSAVVGSINNSATSIPAPATPSIAPATQPLGASASSSAPRSTWPSSRTPVSAGKSSFFHLGSSSGVVQMDAGSGAVTEITPPRGLGSSFVNLPGERVLDSPTVTMHVQRSVLVSADHWVWRTHKKVTIGELTSRIDPQVSHLPVTSGSITVQATIDKDGRVSDLKPLNGSFAFLPSVSKAIREWRYEPTYLDNKPVETQAQIELDFHQPIPRVSHP